MFSDFPYTGKGKKIKTELKGKFAPYTYKVSDSITKFLVKNFFKA